MTETADHGVPSIHVGAGTVAAHTGDGYIALERHDMGATAGQLAIQEFLGTA